MKTKLVWLITFICCFWVCCGFLSAAVDNPDTQPAAETSLIRVGYFNAPGFSDTQADGTVTGYVIDYLAKIATYTGWHYEYVYGTQAELERLLQNGDIDLLCAYTKTPERMTRFDYSETPLSSDSTVLYTSSDHQDIFYDDYQAFNNTRIAIVESAYQKQSLQRFAKEKGFTYTPVYYADFTDILTALANGDADIAATSSLFSIRNQKIVGRFDIQPVYFVTRKYRTDGLMHQLDQAVSALHYDDPYFVVSLQNKHHTNTAVLSKPPFTREEYEYIKQHPPIKLGFTTNRFPLSYWDESTQQLAGITVDIMHFLEKQSGLTFEYVPISTDAYPVDELLAGKFDLLSGLFTLDDSQTAPSVLLSQPYFTSEMVMIGKKNAHFEESATYIIAMPQISKVMEHFVQHQFPQGILRKYPSPLACMQAVSQGDADCYIANAYVARTLLQMPQFDNLSIWSHTLPTEALRLAMPAGADPLLMSILNKTLQTIQPETISHIIMNHTTITSAQITFWDRLYQYRILLTAIGLFLICLILFASYINIRNRNYLKLIEEQNTLLSETIQEAETANINKSHFLARMSHEIRTPLNVIIGFTSLTADQPRNPEQITKNLTRMLQSSQELLALINNILDLAALDTGKLKLDTAIFDIQEVLQHLISTYRERCHQAHLTFTYTENLSHHYLLGDEKRFYQLIDNILSNAVKFNKPNGTVSLCLREITTTAGISLHITITDTGIGMAAGFEKRIQSSSGLGLSISHQLALLMNGQLTLTSEERQGTTCVLTLPLTIPSDDQLQQWKSEQSVVTSPIITGPVLSGKHILIAEDNELNREIIVECLRPTGADLAICNDGKAALDNYLSKPANTYSLILLDIQMPIMNGYETAQAIRNSGHDDAHSIPILAMTAGTEQDEVNRAYESGMNDLISKPLDFSKALKTIVTYTKNIGSIILLAGLLSIFLTIPSLAASGETIRIGSFHQEFVKPESSSDNGYGAEYMDEVARYTHWNYVYVTGSQAELLTKLQQGEIDFLMPFVYTQERQQNFLYSQYPLGYQSFDLYILHGYKVYFNDFDAFNGLRIAVASGEYPQQLIRDYAADHHFQYTECAYPDETKIFSSVMIGDSDIFVMSSLAKPMGYKQIAHLANTPYYIVSAKNARSQQLMAELDNALAQIHLLTPEFEANLQNKYDNKDSTTTMPLFTKEEDAFIREHHKIRVGFFSKRYPLSYYNEATGKLEGIAIDIMAMIARKSGLDIEFVPVAAGTSPLTLVHNGDITMTTGIVLNAERQQDATLQMSVPYYHGKMTLVGKNSLIYDEMHPYRIAIPRDALGIRGYILSHHPTWIIRTYADSTHCLDAVLDGNADLMMQNTLIIRNQLLIPRFESLAVISETMLADEDFAVAIDSHTDPRLVSIINKTIDTFNPIEIQESITKHSTASNHSLTLKDIYYQYTLPFVSGILLFVCIILFSFYLYFSNKKRIHVIKEKNIHLESAINQVAYASNAKSQFLSRMSHEIRTPMNAIIGMTTLALQHVHDEMMLQNYLQKIYLSSQLLLQLISDIMDMSDIEEKKLKISHEPFLITELITPIRELYREQCNQKNIFFDVHIDPHLPAHLIGDKTRVQQILLNLLSNALKFTAPKGTIELKLTYLSHRNDNIFIRFSVTDTGLGMSDEFMTRLFKPFEQADISTYKKYGGSGLGLTITKNLTELMNGRISVQSEEGKGSTFMVVLPFGFVTSAAEKEMPPVPITEEIISFAGHHILIVEDNELNREIAKEILLFHHATVSEAENGEIGWKLFVQQPDKTYDLILMDLQMPVMNGYEATKAIRASSCSDAKTIPIIAMSANTFKEDITKALSAGMNEHIAKPINVHQFLKTLEKYIKKGL